MIDAKKQIVSTLSDILPTYYELYCDADTVKPCITYRETNNRVYANGDTLGYSYVQYDIKIWGKVVQNLASYATQIDEKMRLIGYNRVSYIELTAGDEIEISMVYEGLAKEEF